MNTEHRMVIPSDTTEQLTEGITEIIIRKRPTRRGHRCRCCNNRRKTQDPYWTEHMRQQEQLKEIVRVNGIVH